jgi:hypothetical protein
MPGYGLDEEGPDVEQRDVFRAVNERIHRLPRRWPGPVDYACECEDSGCRSMLSLEPEEFDRITSARGCYIVTPGHQAGDWEVIRRTTTFLVVQAVQLRQVSPPVPAGDVLKEQREAS